MESTCFSQLSTLSGTYIHGDVKRTLKASKDGIFKLIVGQMCNIWNRRTISTERMDVEVMTKMEALRSPVQFMPIIYEDKKVISIVTLHGLVAVGL
ncbi:unnamed protein product [Lactuca virosa]|uniref:CBS domain-containing protein n=1 Tax=Lactuca virosa TaxID=75947 RepID=A0AAU9MYL9_9ASTR|nr:unnamed protein product [Lactuca virosa]